MDYEKLSANILKEMHRTKTYRIAKKISEKRTGGVSPASRYHSAIDRAIEKPEKSRLETIVDIIEALGGTLEIKWQWQRDLENKRVTNTEPYTIINGTEEPPMIELQGGTIAHEQK